MGKLLRVMLGALVVAAMAPQASEAVTVTEAYLFSDWSEPTNVSTPPFTFTGTDGVVLTLDGSGVATSAADFVGPLSLLFDPPFTYSSHTGTINSGEDGGTTAAHVNSEVATLDDVGVFGPGSDDVLNLDYGTGASVTFALPAEGVTRIMIGEDAGLDPFKLELCSDAACTTPQTLFNGFDNATKASILARADFGTADASDGPIDQVFLFRFDETAFGWMRVSEIGDFGGAEGLEIDFIGGAIPLIPPSVIPEPGSMLLFGLGGLGLVGGRIRRRNRNA